MGMVETVMNAADAAFIAVGNIAVDAVYTQVGDSIYNPVTGAVTDGTSYTYDCKAIMIDLQSKDRIGDHLDAVSKLYLITGNDIDGVIPVPGDKLTISGSEMTIVDVLTDPAQAVWEIGV